MIKVCHTKNYPHKVARDRGFAIVMALSLLSLVFLLVISLVNLVGIDLSLADARKQKVLAQAHARMGMMVAIGELQKHLGPDMRVTATADILDERIESGAKYESEFYSDEISSGLNEAVLANQAIDLNENGQIDAVPFGQRYWTGVWKHRGRRKGTADNKRAAKPLPENQETGKNIAGSPQADPEYDPHPAVEVAWLVSGNEGWLKKPAIMMNSGSTIVQEFLEIPDSIPFEDEQRYFVSGGVYGSERNAWRDHQLVVANQLKDYHHPLENLADPEEDDEMVWMFRRPLLETAVPEGSDPLYWKTQLRGEPVKVKKTNVRSSGTSADRLNSHGAYAYWVGDEGVKAKMNIHRSEEPTPSLQEQVDDLTVATYPNINFGDYSSDGLTGGFGLEFEDDFLRSQILNLGVLTKNQGELTENQAWSKKLAAHSHSITANSYGVLSDVRTGGLKRDLSHAFSNVQEWDDTWNETSPPPEYRDFLGFLYKDRVEHLKEIPMEPSAKANQWYDAGNETIKDPEGILAGPRWRVLGSFHNLYTKIFGSTNPSVANYAADSLPRFSGDNFVLFSSEKGLPPKSRGTEFWKRMPGVNDVLLAITSKLNWFANLNRPGTVKHPIQPVLMELKFSQVPTIRGGNLALAMYPSFALWNPYDVAIEMNELYVEVPIRHSRLNCFNPKEYDRWRKWFIWAWHPDPPAGGGGGRPNPPPFPPGFPAWGGNGPVGLAGNAGTAGYFYSALVSNIGRNDPIYRSNVQESFDWFGNRIVRGALNNVHYRRLTNPYNLVRPPAGQNPDPSNNKVFAARNYEVLYQDSIGRFSFLYSNHPVTDPDSNNDGISDRRERHLLLGLTSLRLEPGEKAQFAAIPNQVWEYRGLPARNSRKQYLGIGMTKSTQDVPFVCDTQFAVPTGGEPLAIENIVGDVLGVHQSQIALYDAESAERINANSVYPEPKGLTIYSENPSFGAVNPGKPFLYNAKDVQFRKPIFKTTKTFDTHAGFDAWSALMDPINQLAQTVNSNNWKNGRMPGNGFRVRWNLPGYADKIVLEQFNLRAPVNSFQEGFGDNWHVEKFNGNRYGAIIPNPLTSVTPRTYNLIHEETGTLSFTPNSFRFIDFFEFKGNDAAPNSVTVANFDGNLTLDQAILERSAPDTTQMDPDVDMNINSLLGCAMPRISTNPMSGFFHDVNDQHGSMPVVNRAVLFELPRSPMLSLLQLRHANLSDYSHSPSYILGNSYATTQVGRYKTWGRVRSVVKGWSKETESYARIGPNWDSHRLFRQCYGTSSSPWEWWIGEQNVHMPENIDQWGWYGSVRNVDAQNEHQNTTLDHSFYANRALLDGYFMSGVGMGQWGRKSPSQHEAEMALIEPGVPYRPYRNKRFVPYFRNNTIKETSYSALEENTAGPDDVFRYQSLAGDLLLEGAFNLNSTSVDAWISHLSSLKGLEIPNGTYPLSETPFPRFLNHPDQNGWNKIRSLTDEEITLLAHCLVEQIKLRGPFLSTADFVNRRIHGIESNLLPVPLQSWPSVASENRDSVLGLRGTVQAAIAEAGLNKLRDVGTGVPMYNPQIPTIPDARYSQGDTESAFLQPRNMGFLSGSFGLHAISKQRYLQPRFLNHTYAGFNTSRLNSYVVEESEFGRGKMINPNFFAGRDSNGNLLSSIFQYTPPFNFQMGWEDYHGATSFGEAPDNLLAVEDVATAANKPDWLMQADVLSPILPVSNVRSDTFVIRVMGEPKSIAGGMHKGNRAWIELTVQRTPEYVKSELDAPHHRPHEPFEDRNLDGYWNNEASFREHWLDLNQNGINPEGTDTLPDAVPDLPGAGVSAGVDWFADGLNSDLKLNDDPEEEPDDTVFSTMGINQRFGRKFKIIKFRWIKDQDV